MAPPAPWCAALRPSPVRCARRPPRPLRQGPAARQGGSSDEGEPLSGQAALQAEAGSLADPDNDPDEQEDDEAGSPGTAGAAPAGGAAGGAAWPWLASAG